MRIQAMTDEALAASIGARIQALRLKKNISQEQVAKEAGISRQTLANLMQGKCTLVNLITILRVLGELERISSLIEEIRPSPLQVIQMAGNKRQRATGTRAGRLLKRLTLLETGSPEAHAKKDLDW